MLKAYQRIKNVSGKMIRFYDGMLSGGKLTLMPGDEYELPVDIFHRHFREIKRYCINLDAPQNKVEVSEPEPIAEPVEEVIEIEEVIEEVPEVKPAVKKPTHRKPAARGKK